MNENGDLKKIEKKLFEKKRDSKEIEKKLFERIMEIRCFVSFFSKEFTKRIYKSISSVTPINDA